MFVIWLIAPSRGALFVQHVIFPTKEWWFFSTTLSYWCTYNDFLIPIFRKTTSNQEVWPSIRLFSISKYFEQGNGGIATVWVSRALLTTKQKRGIGIVLRNLAAAGISPTEVAKERRWDFPRAANVLRPSSCLGCLLTPKGLSLCTKLLCTSSGSC